MLKNIDFIEVKPGTIFEDCYGTRRIYLGEFYLNMARLKVNQKSITINKHMKEETLTRRVISYKIKGDREYNHPQSTTPNYIDESKNINDLFINNGKIIGVDSRFTDLDKNANEITMENLKNQIIKYQGTMSYISVSRKVENLENVYEKNIKIFKNMLKEKGQYKMISFFKNNRLVFPVKI